MSQILSSYNIVDVLTAFDVEKIRADFPILSRQVYGKPLVYLDSGASAQKPRQVLEAMTRKKNFHGARQGQ